MEASVKRKIRNVKNKYGIDLSGEVKLPGLENFSTRKEYNAFKEKAQSFTNRYNLTYQYVKNPYGVVKSKKEINQYERDYKRAARNVAARNAEKGKIKMFRNGEFATTVGLRMKMLHPKYAEAVTLGNFIPFKDIRRQLTADNKFASMRELANPEHFDTTDEIMRDSYVQQFEEIVNFLGFEDLEGYIETLKEMNGRDFYEFYMQNLVLNQLGFEIFGSPRYLMEGKTIDVPQQASGIGGILREIDRYRQEGMDRDLSHIPNK